MATSSIHNDASCEDLEEPQVFESVTVDLTPCMKECIKKSNKQDEIRNKIKECGVEPVIEGGILKSFTGSLHSVWILEQYLFQELNAYCKSGKVNIKGTQESSVDDIKTIPSGGHEPAVSAVSSVGESHKPVNTVARKDSECEDSSPTKYTDSIDIDEHVWHYILYKHANLIGEFVTKHNSSVRAVTECNCKHSSSTGVCKLVITSNNEKQLHEASEEIAQIYRLILDGDIISSPVDYPTKSQLNFLQSELDSKAVLLYQSSPCCLIGPRLQMQQAKAAIQSALCHLNHGPEASKMPEINQEDLLNFEIPSGIVVHVHQGNIIHQKTDAIVDAANVRLMAGSGVARAIADAAGKQMENDCHKWVKEHGHLKTSIPMHTTAGNLAKPIRYIIHVAGPDSSHYKDKQECYDLLRKTFKNCLSYANDVLKLESITVPAISSGVYGVPKNIVARLSYEGLMDFVCEFQRRPDGHQHLMDVHFVNIDAETTVVMERVFRHLSEAKYRFEQLLTVNIEGKAAGVSAGQQKSVSERPETLNKKDDLEPPANIEPVILDPSSASTGLIEPIKNVSINSDSGSVKPENTENPEDLACSIKSECRIPNPSVPDPEEVPAESVGDLETSPAVHLPVKPDSSDMEHTPVNEFKQNNQINPLGESIQETEDLEPSDNLGSSAPHDTDSKSFVMVEKSEINDTEDEAGNAGADSQKNSLDGPAQSEKISSKLKDGSSQVGDPAAAASNDVALTGQSDSSDASSSTPNAPIRPKSSRTLKKCDSCTNQETNVSKLDCGHFLCAECMKHCFGEEQPKCPSCGAIAVVMNRDQT